MFGRHYRKHQLCTRQCLVEVVGRLHARREGKAGEKDIVDPSLAQARADVGFVDPEADRMASALGAFAALAPLAVLAVMAVFVVLVGVWRYVSLGSIVSALLFPLAAWLLYHPPAGQTAGAAVASALIVIKHHANIRRLLAGQEPKFRV